MSKALPFVLILRPLTALALPTGGQVVAGQASLGYHGTALTVSQGSQKAILDWQSFGVGKNESVNFRQPGASSVVLNRVLGSQGSAIYGKITANGQVFLVNPNGVYFAPGAQVQVGGLVASTLGISNQNFLDGKDKFSGTSKNAVVNDGKITAAKGGYVAFIGRVVTNDGTISTPGGTTALGAGHAVDLTLAGNQLLHFRVTTAALRAAAKNGGLITAADGTVILSAQAKDALMRTVVNNTGVIQAQGVAQHGGVIQLLGGDSGVTQVGGTLDASSSDGGAGGSVETSGHSVKINNAKITAGKGGSWTVDPVDLTIDSTAATTINTALGAGTSVTEQTSATGASGSGTQSGSNGDINVTAPITWSTGASLTLSAYHGININAPITATGASAGLVLTADNNVGGASSGGVVTLANGVSVTLSGATPSLNIDGNAYSVINSMAALQGINSSGLSGYYALGSDLTQTSSTSFTPIGNSSSKFTGTFDGLGHTVSNLYINTAGLYVGLFGDVGSVGVLKNVGLLTENVTGSNYVGGLAGFNGGTISDAYATGSVSGSRNAVGGLVGYNSNGTISDAYVTGSVSGSNNVGGLVGYNSNGMISDAYATGSVSGSGSYVGGLVGRTYYGTISDAYATGSVSGSSNVGGLVGDNSHGPISDAYATGSVSGVNSVGGLVGYNSNGTISDAYATGSVSGAGNYVGGLVGLTSNGTISDAYATGSVSGTSYVGGLVGYNYGPISDAYVTGSVSGSGYDVGGLVGFNSNGTISDAYATGSVSGTNSVGGLVGANFNGMISGGYWNRARSGQSAGIGGGTIISVTGISGTNAFSTALYSAFNFTTTPGATGNNWVIVDQNGTLNNAGSAAGGTMPILASEYATAIANTHQLQLMAMAPAASYILANNIDAAATSSSTSSSTGTDVWGSAGFIPVGDSAGPFTGTFDGLGHTVSKLYINTTGSYVGLFGDVGSGGVLKNVGLLTENVTGGSNVGGLAGFDGGTISDAYATGSVAGSTHVGGLVGRNSGGTISDAYATSSVSATRYAGGLVGGNSNGTISDAYATGSVSGTFIVGGLLGYNYANGTISDAYATGSVSGTGAKVGGLVGFSGGTISDAYATGSVSGTNYVGGLSGVNGGTISDAYATGSVSGSGSHFGGLVGSSYGSVTDGYWNTTSSGQASSASGTGLTAAQMEQQSSFAGFDFTSPVWVISNGNTTPLLTAFLTPVTVTTTSPPTAQTYDGTTLTQTLTNPVYTTTGTAPAGSLFGQSGNIFGAATPYGGVNAGSYNPSLWSDQQGYLFTYSGVQLVINPAPLTATIIGTPTKTYDGTNGATLTAANYKVSGFVTGQGATETNLPTSGSYASANAGTNDLVTATLGAGNFSANGGTLLSNYTLPTSASGAGTINKAGLSATIIGNPTKIYDGTSSATLAGGNYQVTGFVGGQGASVTQTAGSYASANAGTNDSVTTSLGAGNFSANGGTLLSNYILPTSASGAGTINKAGLTAAIINNPTKIYDGTNGATLAGNNYQVTGFVTGQGASVTQTTGSYASANAGTNDSVTTSLGAGNFSATGGTLLSNYTLPTTASGAGTINKAGLTAAIIGNPTKTYDGTTSATLAGNNYQVAGFVGGQGAIVTQTAGSYASANVGTNDVVTTSLGAGDFSATGGTLLSNYILPTSASGVGTIIAAQTPPTPPSVIQQGANVPANHIVVPSTQSSILAVLNGGVNGQGSGSNASGGSNSDTSKHKKTGTSG